MDMIGIRMPQSAQSVRARCSWRTAMWGVCLLALVTAPAYSQCLITAPESAEEGAPFTLCGPRGYTYRWSGPGITTSRTQRCVSVSGLDAGLYEYTLAIYLSGSERDRCTYTVTVGGAPQVPSDDQCVIEGPNNVEAGTTVQLCAPASNTDLHTYSWTGPGGFRASTSCVRVSRPGVYQLTTRNRLTGHQRTCSHRLAVSGQGTGDCVIRGPDTIDPGQRVRLCGPDDASSYTWSGPGGLSSTRQCVDVSRPGTYTLTIRDRYGNRVQCNHFLDQDEGPGDADDEFVDNCPRNYQFWATACRSRQAVSLGELRTVAVCVDAESQALNWSNDLDGLCQTLRPAAPLTQRKAAARQLATLLANICASRSGVSASNGASIGLDPDTPIRYGAARTIGELAALADRMVARGRGNFRNLNAYLQAVNSGRGIGRVCE